MEVVHSRSLKDPTVHIGQKHSGKVFKQAVIISLIPRVTEISIANISLQTLNVHVRVCVWAYNDPMSPLPDPWAPTCRSQSGVRLMLS